MQGGRLQTLGLVLEVDKQEVDQESAEQEQEDVEELDLRMVDDGCQHQVERSKEHDDGDDGGDLQWAEPWMVRGAREAVCGPWALCLLPALLLLPPATSSSPPVPARI